MARIIPGPLVTDIRNKLGSQVFSRNQHGNYVGALVPITQTPSARKTQMHNAAIAVGAAWKSTLTDAQRNQWDEAAKVQAKSARTLGRDPLSGAQYFSRVNLTLELAGASLITEPPVTSDAIPLESLSLASDADAQSLQLTFTPATVPADHILQVWATPNCSPGKLRLGNRSYWLCDLPAGTTSPASIAAPWLAKPWPSAVVGTLATQTIQPGEKIFALGKFINLTNAARSGQLLASAIATGTGDAMLTTKITLTNDQIKALPSTPISILPAPGAGKRIIPLHAQVRLSLTAAYSNIAANASLSLDLPPFAYFANDDGGQNTLSTILTNGGAIVDAAASPSHQWSTNQGAATALMQGAGATDNFTNQPLNIALANLDAAWANAGDLTGGDPANTMTIVVAYYIADLS